MQVISKIIEINNNNSPSIEYIEGELERLNINPLRWAVVKITNQKYIISVADLID